MNPIRKIVLGSVFAGATVVGAGLAGSVLAGSAASAQTATTTVADATAGTSASSGSSVPTDQSGSTSFDPTKGGHVGANGTKEELLTGDIASKVTAAANAAVPGGTVQRVENDAEGATYEAHMTNADGKQVTVKVNADFSIASIEDGMK